MKNILYIKNFSHSNNLSYLKKFSNVDVNCIYSIQLVNYNIDQLIELIELYDIVILGGGKQHLTSNNMSTDHPEIVNQIMIVKLFSTRFKSSNKILIGICLGCQIIASSFNYTIVPMDNLLIGFNFMDLNTINHQYIINNKYLSNLDYNLLSQSFSFHYDYIDYLNYIPTCFDDIDKNGDVSNMTNMTNTFNTNNPNNIDDKLLIIAKSINDVPYIITNANSNIYGFQFHPEICYESITNVINSFSDNNTNELEKFHNLYNPEQIEKIYTHFFENFINQ